MEYREIKNESKEIKIEYILKLKQEKDPKSIDIFMLLLQDKNFEIRECAAEALVEFGNLFAIQELIKAMASDDPTYRNSAIEALILMGEKVVPFLLAEIDNSDADIRKFVIDSLGEIKSDKAIPKIIKCLDDENENVVHGSCETLGKLKALDAVEPLIKILDRGEWVQFPAIEALGKIMDTRAVASIVTIIKNASDWIKYVAVEALGNIRDESVLDVLFEEILAENDDISVAALKSIEKIIDYSEIIKSDKSIIPDYYKIVMKILNIVETEDNKEVLIPAIKILGKFKVKEGVEKLINILISADDEVSSAALESLNSFGKDIIVNILEVLKSKELALELEIAAIYLLGEIAKGEKQVFDIISEYLTRKEEEIREVAIEALSKILPKDVKEIVEKYITDPSGNVRRICLEIIGIEKFNVDILIVFERLKDKYIDVRESAKKAIIKINSDEIRKEALKRLRDNIEIEDVKVLRLLVQIAGEIELQESVGAVIEIVEKYDSLKSEGIMTLGKLKTKVAFYYLTDRLKDSEVSVRKMAADALGKIKDPIVIEYLSHVLEDEDSWVRFFAANSLSNLKDEKIYIRFIERIQIEESAPVIIEILNGIAGYKVALDDLKIIAKFLDNVDEDVITAAINAYGSADTEKIEYKPLLMKYLSHHSWKVKKKILDIFEDDMDKKDIVHILPLIRDDNLLVKSKALEIVGKIGGIAVINPMISTMMEENLEEIAKKLLLRVKEEGYEKILEGLKSEYDAVRIFTANALTIIGDSNAIPALLEALKDKNWKVRYFSAETLGIIKAKNSINNLVELLDDENKYVVDSALNAIRKIGEGDIK